MCFALRSILYRQLNLHYFLPALSPLYNLWRVFAKMYSNASGMELEKISFLYYIYLPAAAIVFVKKNLK